MRIVAYHQTRQQLIRQEILSVELTETHNKTWVKLIIGDHSFVVPPHLAIDNRFSKFELIKDINN